MSQITEPEERLLIEAAQKDPSRFAELYEQNFHRVYAYVARRVRDRAETQDLTAHVFQQALANLGKFKRFADEKSIREIAAELGRSEGAVKQLQFRGLENLRNRLNEK